MKRILGLLLLTAVLPLSGCTMPEFIQKLPLPWLEGVQQTDMEKTAPTATTTSQTYNSVPLRQRKIVAVSETPQIIAPRLEERIQSFLDAWAKADYRTLLEDSLWEEYITANYKTRLDFASRWQNYRKEALSEAASAGVELFTAQPEVSTTILEPEAMITVEMDDWLKLDFTLLKHEKEGWQLTAISRGYTEPAAAWLANNRLLAAAQPLQKKHQELVKWSRWAEEKTDVKELSPYYQDIVSLERQLAVLEATAEAQAVKETWLAALAALKQAVRAKISGKDAAQIIAETSQLVEDIDRAEGLKETLTEKLEDADANEDLAEASLSSAQLLLEQKLSELASTANSTDTSDLFAAWEELNARFTQMLNSYREQYADQTAPPAQPAEEVTE